MAFEAKAMTQWLQAFKIALAMIATVFVIGVYVLEPLVVLGMCIVLLWAMIGTMYNEDQE